MSAGTLNLTNNSDAVSGAGTAFSNDLAAGDFIVVTVGGIPYTLPVKSINSNTSLTLVSNYPGPTQSAAAWSAIPRVAMNLVTAALVAQSAEALRGLNYDKQNWQSIFSGTGNVTVRLPDGSSWTGPAWNGITTALTGKADKVGGAVPINQGGTGATSQAAALTALLGASAVPVANGGTGGATPAAARAGLGLGTAATRDAGQTPGSVPILGDNAGLLYTSFLRLASNGTGAINGGSTNRPGLQINNGANNSASAVALFIRDGIASFLLGMDALDNALAIGGGTLGNVRYRIWHEGITTVDANGFLKRASPVVKVFGDGSAELNAESAGVEVERLDTGIYRISGVLGFNSDAGWGGVDGGIELPTDKNKLPLVWVDYKIEADGSILLKTYHRTHPTAPPFARNLIGQKDDKGNVIETVKDGDPVDIPAGRCVDLRVEMPENSLWNIEQARLAEEMRAEYERQQQSEPDQMQ
ncbi:phage tail protein [Atlantibacter subterranea]|uniref:phage tail fiber protein n=1 Tax=Atlantibacter subterraneus TaxID=255519 RepID=UPI0020C4BABD|nr:phage tail protein [Atlantibacter subterranea]UTJ46569.1 phage tail protein [Atlantibacter subterranea]